MTNPHSASGLPVYFTGEMVFPWMFEDFAYLRPYKEAADLIARKADWGPLYNEALLQQCNIPVSAAVYFEVRPVTYYLVLVLSGKGYNMSLSLYNVLSY